MKRPPPRSTPTDALLPCTPLVRSPGRGPDQGHVLRLRLLAQRLEGCLLAFAGAVLQRLATVAVILALEGGRYRGAQLVDQVAHRRLQRTALAGRQRQRPGLEIGRATCRGRVGQYG